MCIISAAELSNNNLYVLAHYHGHGLVYDLGFPFLENNGLDVLWNHFTETTVVQRCSYVFLLKLSDLRNPCLSYHSGNQLEQKFVL